MIEPSNPEEWQEAVDLASFMLLMESLRMYGLITEGPEANIERCHEILQRGKELGYCPRDAYPVDHLKVHKPRKRGRPRKVVG